MTLQEMTFTTQKELFNNTKKAPMIIPRAEHPISRRNIDKEAIYILYKLKESGYKAYLVGGSVRDLILGKIPKDFDVGTDAQPEEIHKLFKHSKIIGKRFQLVHVFFKGGKYIEVSTFRKSRNSIDENGEDDNCDIFGTPEEDAFRRDLTINALFYNIEDFSVIDYIKGMDDLNAGIIRIIGDPETRILRDPVRMMRAIRHAARTDFFIESKTWDAIIKNTDKIRTCSIPRVRDELIKDLTSGSAFKWLDLSLKSGIFYNILPFYKDVLCSEHNDPEFIKKLLFACFDHIDKIKWKYALDMPFMLSLLMYPALYAMPEWVELAREKPKFLYHEVRQLNKDILLPYDFKKELIDKATIIQSGYWAINACVKGNYWPKRVYTKDTFSKSLEIYNITMKESGLKPVENIPKSYKKSGKFFNEKR